MRKYKEINHKHEAPEWLHAAFFPPNLTGSQHFILDVYAKTSLDWLQQVLAVGQNSIAT